MKKTLSFLLSLALMLSVSALAIAEAPESVTTNDPPITTILDFKDLVLDGTVRSSFPETPDVAQENKDGSVTLTTNGTTVTFTPPFGFYAFSQDLKNQLNTYLTFWKNPRAMAERLIEMGVNLLVIEPSLTSEVHVIIWSDNISEFFVDSSQEGMFDALMELYLKDVPENIKRSSVEVNGRQYVRNEMPTDDGYIVTYYMTIHAGNKVLFRIVSEASPTAEQEALLADVVASAVYN